MQLPSGDIIIFDKADLGLVMNFQESQSINSVDIFKHTHDKFVPTWSLKNKIKGPVHCSSWPKASNAEYRGKNISLTTLLSGTYGQKVQVQFRDGNFRNLSQSNLIYDRSLSNHRQKVVRHEDVPVISPQVGESIIATAEETRKTGWIQCPLLTDPIAELRDFIILQERAGHWHPHLNPYQLVQYEEKTFYRMKALAGHEFFFSKEDLEKVLRVPCELNGQKMWLQYPVWRLASKKIDKLQTNNRLMTHIICKLPNGTKLSLHRWLGTGLVQVDSKKYTVVHQNGNSWDNRKENLKIYEKEI